MINRTNLACTAALALTFSSAVMAADVPEGQVLFVSGVVKIIDALGAERIAKKGDKIMPDEHVVTGGGSIGQIKLPDGGLIGVRPESDLKFNKPAGSDGKATDDRAVFLSKGAVRIINVEGGKDKPLPVTLQTPTASIALRSADNESVVVPPRAAGGANPLADPGTYSRMAVGSAVLKTTTGETTLAPSQTGFVAASTATPTRIAALPTVVINTTVSPVGGAPQANPSALAPVVGPIFVASALPVASPTSSVLPSISVLQSPNLRIASVPSVVPPRLPVKVPTLVNAGSIDFSQVSPEKLATLPTATLSLLSTSLLVTLPVATLSTLSTATLAKLPTSVLATLPTTTLATLPLETIKSLPTTVQTTVTSVLTPTQQATLVTTVAAPVITTTTTTTRIPITKTTSIIAIRR